MVEQIFASKSNGFVVFLLHEVLDTAMYRNNSVLTCLGLIAAFEGHLFEIDILNPEVAELTRTPSGIALDDNFSNTADIIVATSKSYCVKMILLAIAGGAIVALASEASFRLGAKACAKADFDTMHKLGLC